MKTKGAKALIKSLKAEGVEHIFGILGGVLLPIFDEFYKSDLKIILTRMPMDVLAVSPAFVLEHQVPALRTW